MFNPRLPSNTQRTESQMDQSEKAPPCQCVSDHAHLSACCFKIGQLNTEFENKSAEIDSLKKEIEELKRTVRERLSQEHLLVDVQAEEQNSRHVLAATEMQLKQKTTETQQLQLRLENALAEVSTMEELKMSLCEKNDQVNSLMKEVDALQEALLRQDGVQDYSEVVEAEFAHFHRCLRSECTVSTTF